LEKELVTLEFKANSCLSSFNRDLYQGMDGTDVRNLQDVLNYSPMTEVSSTGSGSPGQETDYFGEATKNAVISFQNIFADQILLPSGLTSGSGYVGPSTRAVLNGLCSSQ
jgi:peptidoglycan hydrolase-like protein with peptidoglycan-binding domain